jgi:hypothetical protein
MNTQEYYFQGKWRGVIQTGYFIWVCMHAFMKWRTVEETYVYININIAAKREKISGRSINEGTPYNGTWLQAFCTRGKEF